MDLFMRRYVGVPGGLRARVVDGVRGGPRTHDAVGLGVEGQLPDRWQRVDKRRRHTRHPVRHVAGLRAGPGSSEYTRIGSGKTTAGKRSC